MFGINTMIRSLNPFRTGRCLSTLHAEIYKDVQETVSIPFEQGDVFRHTKTESLRLEAISLNPFRTGRCLSTIITMEIQSCLSSLNPFRTGRCLSTAAVCWRQESCGLSDPLPNFFGRLRSWLLI